MNNVVQNMCLNGKIPIQHYKRNLVVLVIKCIFLEYNAFYVKHEFFYQN